MKKTISLIGVLLIVLGTGFADIIEQNDYIIFTCNNATDGSLLCSSATIDLYDSNGNIAVNGASATNIATGKFKYQVTNSTDRYTVIIDCCTGAIDYAFQVYVTPYTETKAGYLDASISSRSTLSASDNIGINLNDVTGTLDLNELGFNPALQSNLTQGIVTLTSTTETQIDNIEADTNELQTNQNWNVWDDTTRTITGGTIDTVNDKTGYSLAADQNINSTKYCVNVNDKSGYSLTSATETQIDNIEADTNELQSNQNWNVWDDGTRTLTACPCSGWATPTDVDNNCISESELNASHGSCNYCTATGFSTHSASDVYSYFTSGSNEDVFKADISSLLTTSQFNTNISQLKSEHATIQADLDNPNQYKADVSGLADNTTLTAVKTQTDKLQFDGSNYLKTHLYAIEDAILTATKFASDFLTASKVADDVSTEIYNKFISGSNEDQFKADVSSLATQNNITDLQTHGDTYWNTSTSALTSEQNETLYNIYSVVGTKGKWDQSIADMLGYNSSEGNVETDLDSAGGTTPSAVYTYFTDSGRALNETNGWLSNVVGHPNDFDQTIAEMLNYNVSEGNVETDLDSAGGTTPEAVWSYSSRTITGGNLSTPDDYKADISSLATQSNITDLQSHGDSNWATATGFATPTDISTSESNIISHGDLYWNTSSLSSSDIYTYFTTGTNEDVFKADVSSLATASQLNSNTTQIRNDISSLNDISAADVWQYNNRNLTYVDNVWSVGTRTLTGFNFAVNLTSNAVDDIWDENITYHLVADTTGKALYNTLGYVEDVSDGAADIIYSWLTTDSNIVQDSELSTTEANIKNSISDLNTSLNTQHGSGSWETGLTSDQNDTLHNIYTVVGNVNEYDQSIVQMLGYNSSDGNVETDLDSAGGTTPAAVWSYSTRTITGGNLSTPDDYKANISSVITHGDMYWNTSTTGLSSEQNLTLYNIYYAVGDKNKYDQSILDMLSYNKSDGNVETDLDTTGGTTPFAVWNYSLSSEGTANETLTAIYEAIIKGGFSIQKETCEWYNIPCIIERIIEKVIK